MKHSIVSPILLSCLALFAQPIEVARGAGLAREGETLAERWCVSCHLVAEEKSATDAAPPFTALAQRDGDDYDWVRRWLTEPHPPMEGINLTRQEIEHIIAYLETLRDAAQ